MAKPSITDRRLVKVILQSIYPDETFALGERTIEGLISNYESPNAAIGISGSERSDVSAVIELVAASIHLILAVIAFQRERRPKAINDTELSVQISTTIVSPALTQLQRQAVIEKTIEEVKKETM